MVKNYTQKQADADRRQILGAFDQDQQAQECLRLYRLLPETEQRAMLQAMDAFLRGFDEGKSTKTA